MRYWRLPTLLLVVLLCVTEAIATERILSFQSDIQILPDASLQVHETIKVRSEGRFIRHGIYRDFPTIYSGRYGEHYIVGFNVLDARRDGEAEPFAVESLSNGVRTKIGNASSSLPAGEYTYELTYRVTREVGFFKNHDELYWNVTGNGWGFQIDHASAFVTLPQAVPEDKLKLTGYTGPQGSREQNLLSSRISDTEAQFVATEPLRPHEGLTIVVEFPKGILTPPPFSQQVADMLTENPTLAVILVGVVIAFVYYFIAWMRVGRDPRHGVIVVRYEPPAGMSPAAISFLRHMGYDDRVLVSAVVNLAVKKYLTIQQEASVYRLQKLKSEDSYLSPEEINLMRNLFASSDAISVNALQRTTFLIAKATLTADLNRSENQKLFQKHWSAIWPGILISLATLGVMVLTVHGPSKFPLGFMSLWLSLWSVGVVGCIEASIKGIKTRAKGTFVLLFVAAIFTAVEIGVLVAFVGVVGLLPVIALVVLLIVNFTFIYLMRSLTPEGRRLMDEIEGFRQFMTSVDGDRLQREGAPQKTPTLFETCLPYALALGVEQAWARQFEGVLAQAAMAHAGGGYTPTWYSSNDWSGFNASSFASGFGGDFSSAISSASSPPSSGSGGGGGGGSSGGGGGGGGGGGW
jgi:uncharacterized membrane protein YgcG